MVNNVIFTDLKKQEELEKADEETLRCQQPVMKFKRSKSFSHRRRSSVGLRRASVMRRKSIDPMCVKVRFSDFVSMTVTAFDHTSQQCYGNKMGLLSSAESFEREYC
jgi:hypothetical protein